MAWFSRPQQSSEEQEHLRLALIDVLTALEESTEGRAQTRLKRVIDRLERPPVPSGLRRELSTVMAARDRALAGHRCASTLVPVAALADPRWKMEIALVAVGS